MDFEIEGVEVQRCFRGFQTQGQALKGHAENGGAAHLHFHGLERGGDFYFGKRRMCFIVQKIRERGQVEARGRDARNPRARVARPRGSQVERHAPEGEQGTFQRSLLNQFDVVQGEARKRNIRTRNLGGKGRFQRVPTRQRGAEQEARDRRLRDGQPRHRGQRQHGRQQGQPPQQVE
jgi:hypothetical protein